MSVTPRGRLLAPLGALLWIGLSVGLITPPASATGPAGCARARAVLEAGEPTAAIELIDELRLNKRARAACRSQATAARVQLVKARAQLRLAEDAAAASSPNWAAVKAFAEAALDLDADLAAAEAMVDQADAELHPKPPTWTERLDANFKSWTKWLSAPGKGLGQRTLAALGVVAGILLAARLLLLAPLSSVPTTARFVRIGSGFLTVATAIALVAYMPATWDSLEGVGLFGWLALLGLSIYSIWSLLYHRSRVSIDMQASGEAAKAGATAIVTHLMNLGAAAPRGVEIPLGADVTKLNGSDITTSLKTWSTKLVAVIQDLLAVTPWRVLVDRNEAGAHHVIMTRHGRSVAAAEIPATTGEGTPVDPHAMVAAFVLVTLSKYDEGLRKGLAGATSWRSVGLQYVGAQAYLRPAGQAGMSKEKAVALLRQAADADAGNVHAQYSWWMARFREETRSPALRRAQRWMSTNAKKQRVKAPALAARMRYAAVIFHRNAGGDTGLAGAPTETRLTAHLTKALGELKDDESATLKTQLGAARDALTDDARYDSASAKRLTPGGSYTRACNRARAGDWPGAANYLAEATTAGELAEWIYKDPELTAFRATSEFLNDFAKTPPALLDAPPFAPFKDKLKEQGLSDLAILTKVEPWELANQLGITAAQAQRISVWANRAKALPEGLAPMAAVLIEVAESLYCPVEAQPTGPMNTRIKKQFQEAATKRLYKLDQGALNAWSGWLA
ncbi:MAG: hypothetical protein WAW88_04920 [Nocardioides sp.]